jgi:hypothetical protein
VLGTALTLQEAAIAHLARLTAHAHP